MGVWGFNIAESDDAYDLLDTIEENTNFDPYDIINGRDYDRETAAKSIQENAAAIESWIERDEEMLPVYGILYGAVLLNIGAEMTERQKDIFERAYAHDKKHLEINWGRPLEREGYIDLVKKAYDNGERYDFNSKGLLQTIEEEIAAGNTGLVNK